MLQGRFATKQSEARYPTLWNGLVAAFAPCITGPTGLRLINFGRGGDGTLTNMDAPTDWVRSQGQYCLDFDGTDDYVSTSSLKINPTNSFSISAWVYADSLALEGGSDRCVVAQTNGTGTGRALLYIDNASSKAACFMGGVLTVGPTVLSTGQWYHIAVTYNKSTGNVTVCTNGVAGTPAARTPGAADGNLVIGVQKDLTTGNFDGLIDDVRIYTKPLTTSEIALLARRRGIAFEPIPRHRRLVSRIVDPQPTAATESTGFVAAYQIRKLLRGQYATRKQDAYFPNLWDGCVYAACPSVTGPTGLKLFDFARGNTGTLTNMAAASDWPRSDGRYCLDLDGVNDYVETPGKTLGVSNTFSICCWIKPTGVTSRQGIFTTRVGDTAGSWCLEIGTGNGGTGRIVVTTPGIWNAETNSSVLTAGAWQHICYTKTGTTQKIYLNGAELALLTDNAQTTTDNSTTKRIGTLNTLFPFTGNIDDIRIYNRVIQPSEIRTLSRSRAIAYKPKSRFPNVLHNVTFPAETFTGPYIHVKRTKLLAGKFAVRKEDAKFPQLFEGRVGAWCPSITGPTGLKLFDFARSNTGTLTNMDAAGDWSRSQGRYALDFDGVNDNVNCGVIKQLADSTKATLTFWAFRSSSTNRIGVGCSGNNNRRFHVEVDGSTTYCVVENGAFSYPSINNTTTGWNHYALVFDGSLSGWDRVSLFLNGVKQTLNTAASGSLPPSSLPSLAGLNSFTIGFVYGSFNLYTNGMHDDIAIYNRVLTASEIRILSRSRGIAYTPKQKQYQPHNFAAVAATMSRLLMLRRKRALQCY